MTQQLFSEIAPTYERNNALLSFGLHRYWNRCLARAITPYAEGGTLLDLCAGTGDITHAYLQQTTSPQKVILLDFCPEMLAIACAKEAGAHDLSYIEADAQDLPLEDHAISAVTCAYGMRNIADPIKAGQEVLRVLKPGGVFGILELTRPRHFPFNLLHTLHLKTLVPLFGHAYRYLSTSVSAFTEPAKLSAVLQSLGFDEIERRPLFFGTATLLLLKSAS